MRKGLIIVNLGTPEDCSVKSVRSYLKEFLSDARVITLPSVLRWLLVNCIILPTRPKQSAHAYKKIWQNNGSPLMINSNELKQSLQIALEDSYDVVLAMRYGKPSIKDALKTLENHNHISVLPLFPQYASATTGSIIEHVFQLTKNKTTFPNLNIIRDFYHEPAFFKSQAAIIDKYLQEDDHLLLSYHGLPENQLTKAGCKKGDKFHCNNLSSCLSGCYLSQCVKTSQLIQRELKLNSTQITTSFQSRLGRTPWIKPYTDEMLVKLRNKNIENIAVACPSFVSDCLETLEEIGIQAKEQWQSLGGKRLQLIPCLNSDEQWVKGLAEFIKHTT